MTTFKDIENNPGYRVGDDGSVWSRWKPGKGGLGEDWQQMKPARQKYGHLLLQFRANGTQKRYRFVHHLVLEAFVGPCPPGMECLHRDGNASNNRLDNLKWGTSLENTLDCEAHGKMVKGSNHGGAKLSENDVSDIWRRINAGVSDREIAFVFEVTAFTISAIRHGYSWNHLTGLPNKRVKYYKRAKQIDAL